MKPFFLAVLFLWSWLGAASQALPARDYQVYTHIVQQQLAASSKSAAVFRELASGQKAETVVSAVQTKDLSTLALLSNETQFDSLSLTTISRFYHTSTPSITLNAAFPLATSTVFIEKPAFEKLFKHGAIKGWSTFHRKFPEVEGVFEFSKIAYSDAGDRAVVYCAVRNGALSGNGRLLVLENSVNGWHTKYQFKLWDN